MLVPADVRILEERNQIVGDRAVQRVLEVEHARIRGAIADHQVARVVVAMDEYPRLLQCIGEQRSAAFVPLRAMGIGPLKAGMPRDVPVGKEVELTLLDGAVVGRQLVMRRMRLHPHQRCPRVAIQRRRGSGIEGRQVGARPQIGQQQEAALKIFGKYFRRIDAGAAEPPRNIDERTTVLVRRRRIHRDRRALGEADPEIAAEARIRRGRRQRERFAGPRCRNPFAQRSQPDIGHGHRGHLYDGKVGDFCCVVHP